MLIWRRWQQGLGGEADPCETQPQSREISDCMHALQSEITTQCRAEALRIACALGAKWSAGVEDSHIVALTTRFEEVLLEHTKRFREAGRPAEPVMVMESLRRGQFAHGRQHDADLWADLGLAGLLARRDEFAVREYSSRFDSEIRGIWAPRYARGDDTIADDFLPHLIVPGDDGSSKIASYAGRSPLRYWLRTVFRSFADERRREAGKLPKVSLSTHPVVDHPNEPAQRPACQVSEEFSNLNCDAHTRPVLQKFFDSVPPQDIAILKMLYLGGISKRDIAEFLEVHEANAGRRIEKIKEEFQSRFITLVHEIRGTADEVLRRCLSLLAERFGFVDLVR